MFIGVFVNFINTFAKEYRFKLLILSILSIIAASFEFIGLSLIYTFVILLSSNSLTLPYQLSSLSLFKNPTTTAMFLGVFVALIYIFKDLFMIAHINFQNSLLAKISNSIFKQNYKKFISQNYFQTKNLSGSDKLRILDTSISAIVNGFIGGVLSLLVNSIVALAILLYLFVKFKLIAIIIGIFVFFIWQFENKYFKTKSKKHGELLHFSEREKQNFVLSTINTQKEIIIYGKENDFEKIACKLQEKYSKQRKIISVNAQLPTYFTEIGVMGTFILFVVLMLTKNYDGAHLSASLATIAAIIIRIVPAINKTQYCMQSINTNKIEVEWFINTISSTFGNKNYEKFTDLKMHFKEQIKLENIDFCYEKDKYALKNINFTIKKGDFIGITGASGSGKTTLFNIILGLFKVKKGRVIIDKTALNQNNVRMWQNNISVLSQEFSLPFNTVWQNVTLEPDCKAEKNTDKIIQALKLANIYDEINRNLEKNTKELSSGQKHRIALARAFYFEREVIMLDEATSALDSEAENQISKSIEDLKGKKTIIAIAHRIKTLKNCDKIIYINKGEIIDIDTFDQLKNKHDSFRRLVELSQF